MVKKKKLILEEKSEDFNLTYNNILIFSCIYMVLYKVYT